MKNIAKVVLTFALLVTCSFATTSRFKIRKVVLNKVDNGAFHVQVQNNSTSGLYLTISREDFNDTYMYMQMYNLFMTALEKQMTVCVDYSSSTERVNWVDLYKPGEYPNP